ncbi:hypothetical protein ABEX78_23235 [Priestia megaterium]
MNLIDKQTLLSLIKENKWYHIEPSIDLVSDILAVKLEGKWVNISFIGGEYDKTSIKFECSARGLNEIHQHKHNKNYNSSLQLDNINLDEISVIALSALSLIIDRNGEAIYSKVIKADGPLLKKLKF